MRHSFAQHAYLQHLVYLDLPNNVTAAEAASAPQITPLLESELPKGIHSAIDLLRLSKNNLARDFLAVWDGVIPRRRKDIPFEAFSLAAGIQPDSLFGVIMEAMMGTSDVRSLMRAALRYPDVVSATIDSALVLGPEGLGDRNTLHKHAQFVPQPLNQKIFINQSHHETVTNTQTNVHIDARHQLRDIDANLLRITTGFDETLGMANEEPPMVTEGGGMESGSVIDVDALTEPDSE